MGVDHKEYLLRQDQSIYMAFIDWIACTSREKKKGTYIMYWKWPCEYYCLQLWKEDNFPRRMWDNGFHNFLDLLRAKLPGSFDHYFEFFRLAYSMIGSFR
jgi:hypothetical protein